MILEQKVSLCGSSLQTADGCVQDALGVREVELHRFPHRDVLLQRAGEEWRVGVPNLSHKASFVAFVVPRFVFLAYSLPEAAEGVPYCSEERTGPTLEVTP